MTPSEFSVSPHLMPPGYSMVHLYAGPCDGMTIPAHVSGTSFNVSYGILPEQGEHFVSSLQKPGMERAVAPYVASNAWSEHFNKRVAVPTSFPGTPPREKAAA
jgi:hypothetical protein